MGETKKYVSHWDENPHIKRFIDFKKSILKAELNIATKILPKTLRGIHEVHALDILEIGPGDGAVSEHVVRMIAKRHNIHSYTAIELSRMLFGILKKYRAKLSKSAKRIILVHGDANKALPRKSYDLILAINSAYGLNVQTLKALRKHLKPGGSLAILLGRKSGIIMEPTFIFAHEHPPTSESLRKHLRMQGIPFEYIGVKTSLLKKTDFLKRGVMTDRARNVMPYVIRGKTYDEKAVTRYLKKKLDRDFGIPGELILIKAE
jgi:SAM-dependent methyltransferase